MHIIFYFGLPLAFFVMVLLNYLYFSTSWLSVSKDVQKLARGHKKLIAIP